MDHHEWIDWFLSQPSNFYFVRIDDSYLSNLFNYYGMKQRINHFRSAYELLRKSFVPPSHANTQLESEIYIIEQQTAILYGLLHSRYLLTPEGMEKIYEKYKRGDFPHCPRVLCKKTTLLPYGVSTDMCEHPLKMFCPTCSEVYNLKDPLFSKIDGAFFGNAWIPIFLNKYKNEIKIEKEPEIYIPKIFGFRICVEKKDEDTEETSS
ncbi:Casein kinase II subunit beta [Tritrichomonas foetus]|uniref:Casein kinase II subunit beta n=1 Tax=Tritrichomonas foetus TaxID=1144522 RepID=A0A1J4L392_9EUKA|nr:Casein kinase II subunit beta [Tritrichomonas foetus]|eukprot:OHT16444.1 Casein kinase II subunit beta [Tritrichomonas foetus]